MRHGLPRIASRTTTRFLLLSGARAAIVSSEDRRSGTVRWFAGEELAAAGISSDGALFLGTDEDGAGRFGVGITETQGEAAGEALKPLVDIRSLTIQGVISQADFELLAQAKSLGDWQAATKFCGRCGGATEIRDGGWKLACTGCGTEQFPRIDPVVIMLVTDGGDRCVLAHEPRFPEKMYSTLAGFVEPGEYVAAAVRRETMEEIGIAFEGRHLLRQPAVAVSAFADAGFDRRGGLDGAEDRCAGMEDARWYGREEVRQMLAGKHPRRAVPAGRTCHCACVDPSLG